MTDSSGLEGDDDLRSSSSTKNCRLVLISDLGGTNCRFQLHRLNLDDGECEIVVEKKYPTIDRGKDSSFQNHISTFLRDTRGSGRPDMCVFAVCGPVVDGVAFCASQVMVQTTGPWRISQEACRKAAGAPVTLLNDFVAVGHALDTLKEKDLTCLYDVDVEPGREKKKATTCRDRSRDTIACLGPGTGLGNVFAIYDSGLKRRRVFGSEGCMTCFVARSKLQRSLFEWIGQKEGPMVPVDRVVSGQGIASWYEFLARTDEGEKHLRLAGVSSSSNPKIDKAFDASDQQARVVAENDAIDPICTFAINCFLETLGQEAARLAMTFLSVGGVYIAGGGIASKLYNRIQDGTVLRAYLNQGVSTDIVKGVPLYVSKANDMGLSGCLVLARKLLLDKESTAPTDRRA